MSGQEHALEPIIMSESERQVFKHLEDLLNVEYGNDCLPRLIGPSGDTMKLPESIINVLRQVVYQMMRGRVVTIVPINQLLTTQEAADILNVSRPYLVKLLEEGHIPFVMTGTHRRVQFNDLMKYKRHRDTKRSHQLAELTRMSQEFGLYD